MFAAMRAGSRDRLSRGCQTFLAAKPTQTIVPECSIDAKVMRFLYFGLTRHAFSRPPNRIAPISIAPKQ